MLSSCWIEPMHPLGAVQNRDVFPLEAGVKEYVNGGLGAGRIGKGAHNVIRRIRLKAGESPGRAVLVPEA